MYSHCSIQKLHLDFPKNLYIWFHYFCVELRIHTPPNFSLFTVKTFAKTLEGWSSRKANVERAQLPIKFFVTLKMNLFTMRSPHEENINFYFQVFPFAHIWLVQTALARFFLRFSPQSPDLFYPMFTLWPKQAFEI